MHHDSYQSNLEVIWRNVQDCTLNETYHPPKDSQHKMFSGIKVHYQITFNCVKNEVT